MKISHAALSSLPEAEQLFFVRLAHVLNDLRHIQSLVFIASHSAKRTTGVERDVSLHHLVFALRLLYGGLNEGWSLVKKSWDGDKLGAKFNNKLPNDAKEAFQFLNQYFGKVAYARNVRDKFAFHYDCELFPQNRPLFMRL